MIYLYSLSFSYGISYHIVLPILYIGFGIVAELIGFIILNVSGSILPYPVQYYGIRQARNIFLRRCLSADLSLHTVITERVIRRGRHTAMNAVIGQGFQDFKAIAGMNDVKLYKNQLLSSDLSAYQSE